MKTFNNDNICWEFLLWCLIILYSLFSCLQLLTANKHFKCGNSTWYHFYCNSYLAYRFYNIFNLTLFFRLSHQQRKMKLLHVVLAVLFISVLTVNGTFTAQKSTHQPWNAFHSLSIWFRSSRKLWDVRVQKWLHHNPDHISCEIKTKYDRDFLQLFWGLHLSVVQSLSFLNPNSSPQSEIRSCKWEWPLLSLLICLFQSKIYLPQCIYRMVFSAL